MAPSFLVAPDDCLGLYNALLAAVESPGIHPPLLKELLEENGDHLKRLLDTPPRNDASRTEVKSGT